MTTKNKLLSAVFTLTLALTLCLTIVPSAKAGEITNVVEPPLNLGTVTPLSIIEPLFGATFADSTQTVAIILVNYTTTGWTYDGFEAYMDGVDVSGQFIETHDAVAGTLRLNGSDITPANGILKVYVMFEAGETEDCYIFPWRYFYTAFQSPPEIPTMMDDSGETTACISLAPPEYFAARFSGYANGRCYIFTEQPGEGVWPTDEGEGRGHVRGSAIVREPTPYYWADVIDDPNTCIRTDLTRMKVSWDNDELMVYMWESDMVWGMFDDEEDWFMIEDLTFSGYYKEFPGAPPQYVRGYAFVAFWESGDPGEEILIAIVSLYVEGEHWLSFLWFELVEGMLLEDAARSLNHMVTVWPIEWPPGVI